MAILLGTRYMARVITIKPRILKNVSESKCFNEQVDNAHHNLVERQCTQDVCVSLFFWQ